MVLFVPLFAIAISGDGRHSIAEQRPRGMTSGFGEVARGRGVGGRGGASIEASLALYLKKLLRKILFFFTLSIASTKHLEAPLY